MPIKSILLIWVIVILQSCGQDTHIRTYRIAKTKTPDSAPHVEVPETNSAGFSWKKPESWIPSSGSSMRLASFDIPYSEGSGDLSVIQLGGTGGGIEANVNRWRRQLNLELQSLSKIEKICTHLCYLLFKTSQTPVSINRRLLLFKLNEYEYGGCSVMNK